MIRYGKRWFPVVEFSAEDAGRTELEFLSQVGIEPFERGRYYQFAGYGWLFKP